MNKNNRYLTLSIVLTLIACFIAVIMRLFTQTDLWFQIFAAIIGVIITAIITQVLLRGQTENDAKKEKDTKVFEEKLRIYQDFLHCLYDVIKDGEVTKEEAIQLEFQTSYITMHTDSEHIKVIAQQVKDIVGSLSDDRLPSSSNNSAEKEERSNDTLMKGLFTIVNEFKKELYQTQPSEQDKQNTEDAVKAFSSVIEAVEIDKAEPEVVDTNAPSHLELKKNLGDFTKELINQLNINSDYWSIETGHLDTAIHINIAKKGNEEGVRIILSHEENGEQYFQIHLDYDDTHEAYKHMKWRFGGRQNKWCWWKYLDVTMRNLAATEEIKTRTWGTIISHVSKQMNALIAYVETFERIRQEIYQQVSDDKANVWLYYETVVAFDFDKTLGERLFMDVELHDNGLYTIVLGDRDQDVKKLISRLNCIGFNVTENNLQESRYTAYTDMSAEEAVIRVKEIDAKI